MVISGTAGVGKTALAVHFAHLVAADFPDGQLYVNLRGAHPAAAPAIPEDAIRGFLGAFGLRPDQVPQDADAQAALLRSLLAGRRVLVVLDNASDEQQVRPLLPGSAGCLTVVTSRRQMAGLAAVEGASLLDLDVLSETESLQLLAARLGLERVDDEQEAAARVSALCARLPLALCVVAARAAARSGVPLAALADELGRGNALDALETGDQASSVRAVLSWSYRSLSQPAATMFRLLGLHDGPDITLPAAASLAGMPRPQARAALGELARASLLTEHRSGRHACHDLLRAYAAELPAPWTPRPPAARRCSASWTTTCIPPMPPASTFTLGAGQLTCRRPGRGCARKRLPITHRRWPGSPTRTRRCSPRSPRPLTAA